MTVVNDIVQAVMLAVIIIVMAVPEGLPLMIAIVSAQNMGKMLKDNVLVRKISGIETAGSLNILFSDKTGTITKGILEVVTFINGDGKQWDSIEKVDSNLKDILTISILENTSAVFPQEEGQRKIIGGNGTDSAVLGFLSENIPHYNLKKVATVPFNSDNKYSATQITGDFNYTLLKGAPEKIISKCSYYLDENGEKQELNPAIINTKINELASRAIRVLGLAISEKPIENDVIPNDSYTLVGILGIRDDVRPESIEAIQEVHNAGVQVVMITGDRKDTAVAIAKEAGLLTSNDDVVLTSDELLALSDDEVNSK